MELVIDANILFSALIKDSITTKLLFENNLKLYSPEFIIEEFIKYKDLILKKTFRTEEDFIQIMYTLKCIITIIPQEEYYDFIKEASNISPDEKDIMYFALALRLKCGIWSNDKKLKNQNKLKVYPTEELIKTLNL